MAVSDCGVAAIDIKARSRLLAGMLAALAAFIFAMPGLADEDLRLPRVVIASGGPYNSRNLDVQKFYDTIAIPREYSRHPLSMVCTNGSETAPGFEWVRVFLLPDKTDQQLQPGSETLGRMLVNENSFLSTAQIYLNMTGQLSAGANRICIQAAGRVGARFTWEVRSIGAPHLFLPPYSSTVSGAWLDIQGTGFSLRPEENTVRLGPVTLPVAESGPQFLRVFIPKEMPPETYDLSVSIRNFRSRVVKLQVVAPKQTQ